MEYPICKSLNTCPQLPAGNYQNAYFRKDIVEFNKIGIYCKWKIPIEWSFKDGGHYQYKINNFQVDEDGYLIYRPHLDVDVNYIKEIKK